MKNPECIASFGPHLRKLRERADISQQDLADGSDVDKKTIQRIENGRMNPSLDVLASLASGLGCSLAELLDFDYGGK